MKLVSYRLLGSHWSQEPRVAILEGHHVIDIGRGLGEMNDMLSLLRHSEIYSYLHYPYPLDWLQEQWDAIRPNVREEAVLALDDVELAAPLPNPTSLRDFYAFEQHVQRAREQRGLSVVSEWYEMPVFYFSNHQAILGPNDAIERPAYTQRLDFELEIAAVIGVEGRDIPAEGAEEWIAGYMIMNDWSARDVQAKEMKVGLGPAKGKDFGTAFGPWLVTPDELQSYRTERGYNLEMVARRNGVELSRGNWQSIHFSFAEMIARASANVTLYPGDVIGSGTVGTGCILELTPEVAGGWLQPGDIVELEVEQLGLLRNVVR